MPKRKPVPSLKDLSLSNLSSQNENKDPFSILPNNILDEIVDDLAKYSKLLRPQHLKTIISQHANRLTTIIHPFTNQLDFCKKPRVVVQRGIELILEICPTLTHLNLAGTKVEPDDLKQLATSIPNIKYLHLKATKTTDDVLSTLSNNCPKLRDLNVRNCASITDAGIISLCEENYGGQCRRIRELRVAQTAITDEGAFAAICNLPELRYFDYKNTLSVLEKLHSQIDPTEWISRSRLTLEVIHSDRRPISNSTLNAASFLCQNITTVVLSELRTTDHWLLKLADFPRLQSLTLTSATREHVTFDQYIAPLLKIIGPNLKWLDLRKIDGINIRYIGLYCHRLKTLSLFENNRYSTVPPRYINDSNQLFVELNFLRVKCSIDNDIPADQLESLLSNCHRLLFLYFHRCQSLTDELLSRVIERNSLSKLFYFNMLSCNGIQKTTLFSIINICESLKILFYCRCAGIGDADHLELQSLVQNENLDLILRH